MPQPSPNETVVGLRTCSFQDRVEPPLGRRMIFRDSGEPSLALGGRRHDLNQLHGNRGQ